MWSYSGDKKNYNRIQSYRSANSELIENWTELDQLKYKNRLSGVITRD